MVGVSKPIVVGLIVAAVAVPVLVASLDGGKQEPEGGSGEQVYPHQVAEARRPLYWGAWIGRQITGEQPPWDMTPVYRLEALLGKGLSIVEWGSPFANCSSSPCSFYAFPRNPMSWVRQHGAIPLLSWSSQSTPSKVEEPDFQLSDVIAGTHDSYIRKFAEDARDWGHPFFLRFNWEMNADWFPWGEGVNGNQPGEYVAAWQHVHDIFTAVGATNATWVWCPYASGYHEHGRAEDFYPGDAYVDWTCLDGYNWAQNPVNPEPWRSFKTIFEPLYRKVVQEIAPGKPMMLGELASNGPDTMKANWIHQMFADLDDKFRRVRAVVWFDDIDRGLEWPIESSPASVRAFSEGVGSPRYEPNVYSDISERPIAPPP